jgi:microcystin-dependent protein
MTAWPLNRAPEGPAVWDVEPMLAEPIPVPVGRGAWRLSLHERQFSPRDPRETLITEIVGARGVRLETAWNAPAKLTLTLDGHHPTTALIRELQTDIYAWRWDEWVGAERCMFRGVVSQALDQLTEQSFTVNFTCHDYAKMLERRLLTNSLFAEQVDQDAIVMTLLDRAKDVRSSSGVSFSPGSYLPLEVVLLAPDGSPRGSSGMLRDRNYPASSNVAELLDNLANVIGGFDYDVVPGAVTGAPTDLLRVFYPYKGQVRDNPLVYGVTVSALTRSANSANYANYWRTLGFNAEDPDAEQLWAEDWNDEANDPNRVAVGTWMAGDNAADVSEQDTLQEKATGNLATYGQLIPSFTLTLRPGAFIFDQVQIGDVLPLVVQEGRLDLQATVRLLGLSFSLGDNGQEDIELEVGRPTANLFQLLTRADRDVDALTRRDTGPTGPDAPVGSMFQWPGVTPPTSWMWAQGQALSRTTYPELFDVIGYAFGGAGDLYNLPDCADRMMVGVGARARGAVGGVETVALSGAQTGAHAHTGPVHTHGGPSHTHTEAAHAHTLNNHSHGGTTGAGAHTHVYNAPGAPLQVVPPGGNVQQAVTNAIATATSGVADHAHQTGGPNTPNTANGNGAGTGAGGTGATGGPSAANTGTSPAATAHENMPPFIAIGTMIRVLPPVYKTARRRRP